MDAIDNNYKQDFMYCEINKILMTNALLCNHLPKIHHHDKFKRTILVDDLGINLLSTSNINHPSEIYLKLLDVLVEMSKFSKYIPLSNIINKRKYDRAAMEEELEELYLVLKSDVDINTVKHLFNEHLDCIIEQPLVICHRDFQSKNIILFNSKPYIIDIQDTCMGPMLYDLVSLVFDYKINMDSSSRNYYINYFIAKTSSHEVNAININKWIISTNIIRTAKSAGRHYKIYKETQNQESLTRHKIALDMLIKLIPQLFVFFNK